MPQLPKLLARSLGTLAELDLAAIRDAALRPFRLALAGSDPADLQALVGLLAPTPAIVLQVGAESACDLALVVSRGTPQDAQLETLMAARSPLVLIALGAPAAPAASRVGVTELTATALPSIAAAIARTLPGDARLALARAVPSLRSAVNERLIDEVARANAAYALSSGLAETIPALGLPLNVADIVVLTKNQLLLAYRIALAAGKDGTPRALLGEVLGVVGSGFLLRQASRSLVGLVPVIGLAPKVAVAYAGTQAIGRAVALWASEGHRASPRELRRGFREARARYRAPTPVTAGTDS